MESSKQAREPRSPVSSSLGEFVGFKNTATGNHVFGWVDQAKYIPDYNNKNADERPSIEYVVKTNRKTYSIINPDHLVKLKRVLPKHEMYYISRNT